MIVQGICGTHAVLHGVVVVPKSGLCASIPLSQDLFPRWHAAWRTGWVTPTCLWVLSYFCDGFSSQLKVTLVLQG